jgi:hypothetical protein
MGHWLLTAFGLAAVTAMMVFHALEHRGHWFTIGFAASCLLGSAYGFMQGAWPFGVAEGIWSVTVFRKWNRIHKILQATSRKVELKDPLQND